MNTKGHGKPRVIHHMDLYRLPDGCDVSILQIPEIYSTSMCLIEWPQRLGDMLIHTYACAYIYTYPYTYIRIQIHTYMIHATP